MSSPDIHVTRVTFEDVLPLWESELWPNRDSPIEPYSAIEFGNFPYTYNQSYVKYPVTFFGVYCNKMLIAVNSGHLTGNDYYRSRGLYVEPKFRGKGLGPLLLRETLLKAVEEGAQFCWSMPRVTAFSTYSSVGFVRVGDMFKTETADQNFFAICNISKKNC